MSKPLVSARGSRQGLIQGGDRPPPNTYKLGLFTMIVYNSETTFAILFIPDDGLRMSRNVE